MLFESTNRNSTPVTFRHAVLRGLAPDGGLWMPSTFPQLPKVFFDRLPELSLPEIGFEIAKSFVENEVPAADLRTLIDNAIDFPAPLVRLSEDTLILELFHGPTLAFKDFGARFLGQVVSYFLRNSDRSAIVLVATSGDTGSAVASAFYGMSGIRVVLLYPSGQVSEIQEKQMTTLGGNISALEIKGTFDDCQKLVKQAFQDKDLSSHLCLISANSINIARLIPQTFYYFYASGQMKLSPLVYSVPSGNFGNLTAGLFAKRLGLPVQKFIAATNVNDTVPVYLKTGLFTRQPSRRTLSNAMDVGNPSNFARMLHLYDSDAQRMRKDISGLSFTDEQTKSAIEELLNRYGYVCDPHTAVAYLGLKASQFRGVVLSTAHPAKFESITGQQVEIPVRLNECMMRPKQSIVMENDFAQLMNFLTLNTGPQSHRD